jgi:hypothetical protein
MAANPGAMDDDRDARSQVGKFANQPRALAWLAKIAGENLGWACKRGLQVFQPALVAIYQQQMAASLVELQRQLSSQAGGCASDEYSFAVKFHDSL